MFIEYSGKINYTTLARVEHRSFHFFYKHLMPLASVFTSEIHYRRLFESAKDGILILDAQTGMIVDVNPFLMELLGYSKES